MNVYRYLTFYVVPIIATIVTSYFYITDSYVNFSISFILSCVVLFLMGYIYNRFNRKDAEQETGEIPNPFLADSNEDNR